MMLISKSAKEKIEWLDTLSAECGVGLWDAFFPLMEPIDVTARWTWSAEFRRLLGFSSENDFPNRMTAWSDRLHPDDYDRTFDTFGKSVQSVSHFDTTYRLKMKDDNYRWFRATGGIIPDKHGRAQRACGSLVDIHDAHTGQIEQQTVVEMMVAAIKELANGKLDNDLGEQFPINFDELKESYNHALNSLRKVIGLVSQTTANIRVGSHEIAQASEDLARRTESNAASLEQTSASVTQMDDRLKATAAAAARTVERADQAIATVGDGRSVADEAVRAMNRVSDSAKGIDFVIEGLDKIAFQTRVLAMNAAVEAGRAGDAGRGFAVVADLVSALAMRAEEEAKRARDQLTVTQSDIDTAVNAVTKVDGALAAISGDVGQVHNLLESMASDNLAQSAAITEISLAVCKMDQSTRQNAAMVEETSAAARNLSSEVENLASQASHFTTRKGGALDSRKILYRQPDNMMLRANTSAIQRPPISHHSKGPHAIRSHLQSIDG